MSKPKWMKKRDARERKRVRARRSREVWDVYMRKSGERFSDMMNYRSSIWDLMRP